MAAGYPINVFWSDEDGAWVADVPDLGYCSAMGDTPHAYAPELPGLHIQGEHLEEARANAEEALVPYVKGMQEGGGSLRGLT